MLEAEAVPVAGLKGHADAGSVEDTVVVTPVALHPTTVE